MSDINTLLENMCLHQFIEHVDPEWKDHFLTVDDAFRHYYKYMTPREFKKAAEECLL